VCALTSAAAACSRPAVAEEAGDAPPRREVTWPASRSARAPVVMSGSWMMERRMAPRAAPVGWGAEPKQKGAGQVCYSRLQTTTTRGARDGAWLVGVASLYSDRAAPVVVLWRRRNRRKETRPLWRRRAYSARVCERDGPGPSSCGSGTHAHGPAHSSPPGTQTSKSCKV